MRQLELFKTCSTCSDEKSVLCFDHSGGCGDGRKGDCKACRARSYRAGKGRVRAAGRPFIDLTGQRFGKLVVLGMNGRRIVGGRVTKICWNVRCDCGTVTTAVGEQLRSGHTASCGCYRSEFCRLPVEQAAINKFYRGYVSSAAKCGRAFDLSRDRFVQLILAPCEYCGAEPSLIIYAARKRGGEGPMVNGVDRIDSSGGYTEGNVATCCQVCNIAKHTMSLEQFKAWIERVHRRLCARDVTRLKVLP